MLRLEGSVFGKDVSVNPKKLLENAKQSATDILNNISNNHETSVDRFSIDESADFTILPEDDDRIAFLKQHAAHWKREAQGWRKSYYDDHLNAIR